MERSTLSPRTRRWINRLGFALMLFCAALTAAATLAPTQWEIGPVALSLRSVRNPAFGLIVGYIMWRMTYDGYGLWVKRRLLRLEGYGNGIGQRAPGVWRQFRELWRRWGWRERSVFAVVAAQALFVLRFWQGYPSYLAQERQAQEHSYRTAAYVVNGQHVPNLECFGRRVNEQLPPTARILYHGQTAALRFAYEVYPRRVFMLPQELTALAASWHVQPQLRDIPEDRQLAYWRQRLPNASVNEQDFIRDHRIDYVVTFDEYDLARSRVEPAP
jgi:hypothetical protein